MIGILNENYTDTAATRSPMKAAPRVSPNLSFKGTEAIMRDEVELLSDIPTSCHSKVLYVSLCT